VLHSSALRYHIQSAGHIHVPIQWTPGALSAGIKQPECEGDHSDLYPMPSHTPPPSTPFNNSKDRPNGLLWSH